MRCGFSWAKDSLGRPWIVTTDQGMGASVWWPNKDTQADEPDSQRVALTVPTPLINVSNGRLRSTKTNPNGTTTYVQLTPSATVSSGGWTELSGTATVAWSGALTSATLYVETAAGTDGLYLDDASFQ